MSHLDKPSPGRRQFIARVATAAAVVASGACAAPLGAAAQQGASPMPTSPPFDDSWTRRVMAARHRAVMDSPEVDDGSALVQATLFMQGYRQQLDAGGNDVVPVVVMRHHGTVMAFGDAIWAKYALGEYAKITDPATGKNSLRNPFVRVGTDDKNPLLPADSSMEALLATGTILLACNRAAMRLASLMAKKLSSDVDDVRAEFRAGVVPGVLLQPSGVYAILRAQDVGCAFIRST